MGKLADIFGGNIADGVAKIISLFKLDPNVAAQHAEELAKIQADLVAKQMDAATAEVQAARDTIVAEAQSGDSYTRRARPSFMYLVEFILAFNFIILPLIQMLSHQALSPMALPSPLLWLFGSAILGYTGARSWDKFMEAPGDSSISLPLGIKASQNTGGKTNDSSR